ncbi:TetR/AcrR family transcriptional regulator [Acinetobacter brisouii]|uniref:TetR/AcrR family transcriptional regulator n=1 Tax=Acinetobacter brisouii TaxID=396323 RepID=UPI001D195DC4|nr:TetR/AcrR family transcriptional regulator [Acinetobacter brisouii]
MKDRKDGLAMSVRAERKLQSQQAILEQVLKLSYAGQCFNSISLRQLAQAVGMVPSAFYRYFPNKEQLAAELVDQTSLIIKSHLVQIAEHVQHKNSDILEKHLNVFCHQIQFKAAHWHFFIVERWNSSAFLQDKIQQEIKFLVDDLAQVLHKKYGSLLQHQQQSEALAALSLELHFAWVIKWLHSKNPNQQYQFLQCFIQQLQFIQLPQ